MVVSMATLVLCKEGAASVGHPIGVSVQKRTRWDGTPKWTTSTEKYTYPR